MDIFEKLNHNLEPLEGDLFIDGFVEAVRGPVNATVKEEAPQQTLKTAFAAHGIGGGAEIMEVEPGVTSFGDFTGEEAAAAQAGEAAGSENEVEAFLNRDKAEGADEDEIQEFLADRSGFDPTEFE